MSLSQPSGTEQGKWTTPPPPVNYLTPQLIEISMNLYIPLPVFNKCAKAAQTNR